MIWLYMIVSASKHKELIEDIANLQKSNLTLISKQAASMKYRFSVVISDKQINENEAIDLAYLLEEFRNIIKPLELLCLLNKDESLFVEVRSTFDTADQSITLNPYKPTVPEVKKTIEALDVFAKGIQVAKERYFYQ
ncbi:hypothetical protein [Paenibacillus sp. 481]|uniref:hypothetical protein n=1 Tax=Paenibacillus sp. 481 TaxID=2835869 RepID=UPI001E4DB401|nr:hypothetical protein [Paenibacillus sp. 481]UHA73264.1 hypothetical protein KIK04_22245 [Paenibacillus sp. 481]